MFEPMFLWVTRTAPWHLLTAHRLRATGHTALAVPVLQVRAVACARAEQKPDALAFTSAHGVRHHPFRPSWRDLPVFAVGDHSAETARRAGYSDVRSANGDVNDLRRLIVTTLPRPAALIHFCASEPAGDLAFYLLQSGYEAERIAVYETLPAPDEAVRSALASLPMLDGIVVHSPKAARRVAQLISGSGWSGTVFNLSRACADEFRKLPGLLLEIAPKPTEESLMNLLRVYRGRPPRLRGAGAWGAAVPLSFAGHRPAPPAGQVANDNPAGGGMRRLPIHRGYPDEPDDPPPTAA